MPTTQRPFFYNFLAAFRAHSALKSHATTSTGPASTTAALSTQATNSVPSTSALTQSSTPIPASPPSPPSAPRAITSTSPQKTPSSLVSAFSPPNHTQSNHHASRHHARRPSNNPMSRSPVGGGPVAGGAFGSSKHRRSSDSSSDGGFRDALGGEKWFIGGRTAQGEEKFYKLGMVRRERSGDRASLDRMSL